MPTTYVPPVFSGVQEVNMSEMRKATAGRDENRTSVPQIWINKEYIGNCDDLKVCLHPGNLPLRHISCLWASDYSLRWRRGQCPTPEIKDYGRVSLLASSLSLRNSLLQCFLTTTPYQHLRLQIQYVTWAKTFRLSL